MDGTESEAVQINYTDDSPSVAMSATILSLKLKFPNVKQISTDILESWVNSTNSDDGKFPKLKGKLIIIVSISEIYNFFPSYLILFFTKIINL